MMEHKVGQSKKGERIMRKFVLMILAILLFSSPVFADERHNFYSLYDPNTSWAYSKATGDLSVATGDQVAVNTFSKKTIQISSISVNEYVEIRIEGRTLNQVNIPNWTVLDTVGFGQASDDTSRNVIVDVTEYVDFLRVGIASRGTATQNGTSQIDVEGIFGNPEK